MGPGDVVSVLADDPPPVITDGYATYDTVAIPGRRGISRFNGYDPYALNVPVQFENYADGDGRQIEQDIATIERMCGVGLYSGARVGPPSVIRVSVTDNNGNIVPLISPTYQWTRGGASDITWRITGLAWDANPIRTMNATSHFGDDPGGRRVRQKAVISLTEYTPIITPVRSAAARSRHRNHHHDHSQGGH
jgi:hypothetical protein